MIILDQSKCTATTAWEGVTALKSLRHCYVPSSRDLYYFIYRSGPLNFSHRRDTNFSRVLTTACSLTTTASFFPSITFFDNNLALQFFFSNPPPTPGLSLIINMAAFSYQYHPFLVDSAFLSNINTGPPSHNLHHLHHHETSFNDVIANNHHQQEAVVSCGDQSSKVSISDNEPSVTKNNISPQSSMVVDKLETGEQVTQKVSTPMERKRRTRHGSSLSNPQSKHTTEERNQKMRKSSGGVKEEDKPKAEKKDQKKGTEEPPTGYIHVRARRGQATDSHSLAERVRREKISERMKMLQRLVPGCDKVTGKALMLDEIINYVQSLQNQIEFLSMKLASVNPMFYELAADLDTLLVRPEKLNSITPPSPPPPIPVPHCSSPNQGTTFADATTMTPTTTTIFSTTNDYLLDSSASVFLQGQGSSNLFSAVQQ